METPTSPSRCLVVTPEMFVAGYLRWSPTWVYADGHPAPQKYPFKKVRDLPDGNILVEEPRW